MLSNSPTESFRKLFLGTCQAFTGTLRLNGTTFRPTNLVQKVPPALVRFTSNLNLIARSTWDLKFEGNHKSPFTQIFITNMLWWCRCPHAPNKGGFPLSCLPAGPLHLGWVSTKTKKCTQNLDPPTFFSPKYLPNSKVLFFPWSSKEPPVQPMTLVKLFSNSEWPFPLFFSYAPPQLRHPLRLLPPLPRHLPSSPSQWRSALTWPAAPRSCRKKNK